MVSTINGYDYVCAIAFCGYLDGSDSLLFNRVFFFGNKKERKWNCKVDRYMTLDVMPGTGPIYFFWGGLCWKLGEVP